MPSFVAYVSSATRLLSTAELGDLLASCRRNNATFGVTGALLYQGGNFMQVLEGDHGVVHDLYAMIAADSRHHDLIVLVRGETDVRQFEHWSMAFADLSGGHSALAQESRSFLEDGPDAGSAGVGRRLLLSFRRTLDSGRGSPRG